MNIFSVGCSFTEGQGAGGREKSYTRYLSNKLNVIDFNFGEAGHSNQYIFRKSIELLKNWEEDDILIVQWTNPIRDEIITNEGYLFYPPFTTFMSLSFLYGQNPENGLKDIGINDKNKFETEIIKNKQKFVTSYCENFYNKDYQLNLSFCFQLALYGLLEKMKIKYIMFFGWEFETDFENQKQIFNFVNEKFLKETFSSFTNTKLGNHPNTDAHLEWANHLYKKIIEFNYITNI